MSVCLCLFSQRYLCNCNLHLLSLGKHHTIDSAKLGVNTNQTLHFININKTSHTCHTCHIFKSMDRKTHTKWTSPLYLKFLLKCMTAFFQFHFINSILHYIYHSNSNPFVADQDNIEIWGFLWNMNFSISIHSNWRQFRALQSIREGNSSFHSRHFSEQRNWRVNN